MSSRVYPALLAAGLFAISSCASVAENVTSFTPDEFTLSTDRSSYFATYMTGNGPSAKFGFTVIATFTNNSPSTVFLARCFPGSRYPVYGVLTVGSPSGAAYDGDWACVGHNEQIIVAPGKTRVDTLHISGPNAVDGITKEPLGTFTGQMRLAYEVQACRGDGACRISGAGDSNVFSVAKQTDFLAGVVR